MVFKRKFRARYEFSCICCFRRAQCFDFDRVSALSLSSRSDIQQGNRYRSAQPRGNVEIEMEEIGNQYSLRRNEDESVFQLLARLAPTIVWLINSNPILSEYLQNPIPSLFHTVPEAELPQPAMMATEYPEYAGPSTCKRP